MQDRLVIPGNDDVRAQRSRDELAWALIALMRDRSYDDISVQDICAQAGVGRSTFYAHFADKDEMFVRHIVVFGEWMGGRCAWDGVANGYRFEIEFLLNHVRDMRPVYDSLMKSRKVDLIVKVWRNKFADGFERIIRALRGDEPATMPPELLAQHLAGTVVNLLTWWLDHHYPMEPADVQQQFGRLVAGLR